MDIFDIMAEEPKPDAADYSESPPSAPSDSPSVAPLPAVQTVSVLSAMSLAVRNQIAMLSRTLYTLDKTITAEAVHDLWPERATLVAFGFDENGAYKAPTPSIEDIGEYLKSEDYRDKMVSLGVWLAEADKGLSSKQIAFLTLVTDISSSLPLQAKLKKVGGTWAEFVSWQKQAHFKEAYGKLGGDALRSAIPLAELALATKMIAGDTRATELGFLLTGHFDPNKNKQIDAQKLFGILLEIIDEKVKDPNERLAIGQELTLRGTRAIEM